MNFLGKKFSQLAPTIALMLYGISMAEDIIAGSALHEVPDDLRKDLLANKEVLEKWNSLTPLARNEWICWMTIVKKEETRADHLRQISERLLDGERRPCCWPGCPHRNGNAKKWFKKR